MSELSKEYNFKQVEEKWEQSWDSSIYYFDWESEKPQYIIDTPPPYPTGDFHIGNALNWCYIDFAARYKRMRGYNVMFPQGWDCHGLPTEVKVEQINHITKNQVPRAEFRRLCEKLTEEAIDRFHKSMGRLGLSIDWSNEYATMKPEYYVKTQASFVRMYRKGQIYREEHPVNWCPRCGTAIALAEVEYDSRISTLNYMHFQAGEGEIEIATSRPELLPACVAVAAHPEDQRYQKYIGGSVKVPIFDYKVPVIADPAVDSSFGSGLVMICTFGDKQDVRWWMEHHLPLRQAIDRSGRMMPIAGPYSGLTVEETKDKITRDLTDQGVIFKHEPLEQNVGLCWRCKTPIEILSEPQWFVRIDSPAIKEMAEQIEWVPLHMRVRLENWADSMEWDWCISRQRIFATPIPAWYCCHCHEALVAEEEWLPLDPNQTSPPERCRCGSSEFIPEQDVLDTWMDSSISALAVAGWPDRADLRMPTQLRPQGHDIIRTWAFYTILRTEALEGIRPWDTILINGMALGEDGHKMSKSLNNFIRPEEVFERNGADALRQWAAIGGSPGNDIPFQWKEITAASRFQQKIWSIFRFSLPLIASTDAPPGQVDGWLSAELDQLITKTTEAMDRFQFDEALKAIRAFAWDVLADNYIELVKARLYGQDGAQRRAAQNTLFTALETLARLMAPFTPFLSEEIYHALTGQSVHVQSWPVVRGWPANEAGRAIKEVAATIRRYKSEKGMALNSPLPGIVVYSDLDLETADLAGVANSPVESRVGSPSLEMKPVAVKPQMKVIGPRFKDTSQRIIAALMSMNPADVARQREAGSIRIDLDGEAIQLPPEGVEVEVQTLSAGEAVDILRTKEATVLVRR